MSASAQLVRCRLFVHHLVVCIQKCCTACRRPLCNLHLPCHPRPALLPTLPHALRFLELTYSRQSMRTNAALRVLLRHPFYHTSRSLKLMFSRQPIRTDAALCDLLLLQNNITSLRPHLPHTCRFLELTYSRQSFRSDAALCDLLLLLEPLAASPELVQELQAAEAAVQSYLAGGAGAARRPSDGGQSREFAAWAVEQACDWEAAAVAGMQLGSGGLQVSTLRVREDIQGVYRLGLEGSVKCGYKCELVEVAAMQLGIGGLQACR